MFFSATEAKYKFYVVKGADLMTSAAQNALLKVLEEPPSNVHIILLATEADKILTTIKSRTQFIQTELFEYERLKSFVLRHSDEARVLNESNPEQFKSVLLSAYGVIGNALALLDGKKIAEESERRDTVLKFLSVMPKKTPFSSLYTATLSLPQKREELRCVLEETITALRDMIAVKLSDDISTLFFTERDAAEATLGTMSVKRLTKIFDIISSALRDIDKNVLIAPLLTDVAVRIKEA